MRRCVTDLQEAMTQDARPRYPDFSDFAAIGALSAKLIDLSPQEQDRIESMLSSLRVNWNLIELENKLGNRRKLWSAYINLHELYIVTQHLSREMTTKP
jgi:hypothetical protein